MIKNLLYSLFLFQLVFSGFAQVKNEPEVKIIFDSFSLEKSRNINAAVVVKLNDGWHIYWRNPGDSGMPTSFEFILPENVKVSEIKWAVPKIFEFEGYASYGYEGLAVFPFSIYIPENFKHDEITLEVNLKSLICKDVCKPFNQKISRTIKLDEMYIASKEDSDLLFSAYDNLPAANDKLELQAKNFSDSVVINISSDIIKINRIKDVHFIPYENGIFKNSVAQNFTVSDSDLVLTVEFDPFKTKIPDTLYGILVINLISEEGNSKLAFEVNEKIQ
ncbi:MAG: protein-disulfide reductase DsbD domain-containing protein [Ignavibacterium sp.]